MQKAWIRCTDDVFIRTDSVVGLRNSADGLYAETLTDNVVQLTSAGCPGTAQLALLEEIRSAEYPDDRYTRVIIPVSDRESLLGVTNLLKRSWT
jgi:hypothetical protein